MLKVEININFNLWKPLKLSKFIKEVSKLAWKAQNKVKSSKSEVSILLTDDDFIHELNKKYRNMDKPTNVLSFPLDDDIMRGDIIIAYETVLKEAKEENKSFKEHLALMVIHGILHLAGYDHIDDNDAEEMEALEQQIIAKINWD